MMFEQAFRNIDDVLRKEAGCTTELDYIEQTSWLLFLKYMDSLEQDKADEAALEQKKYTFILDKPYRWESWAAPKAKDGKIDHNRAMVVGHECTRTTTWRLPLRPEPNSHRALTAPWCLLRLAILLLCISFPPSIKPCDDFIAGCNLGVKGLNRFPVPSVDKIFQGIQHDPVIAATQEPLPDFFLINRT